MKKIILIILCSWFIAGSALAAGLRIEVKGSFFSAENSIFRDVYGSAAKFGFEGGLNIAKNLSVFAGLGYLHKTGELTVTREGTEVWITPLNLGIRYEIPAGEKLNLHIGAGMQEVFFKEEQPLGTAQENGLGILFTGGGMVRLTRMVGIGLFLEWSTCKLAHEGVDFKVGGLDLGAGIEIRF